MASKPKLDPNTVQMLVQGDHGAPFEILGRHRQDDKTLIIHALNPQAKTLSLIPKGAEPLEMKQIHAGGLFEVSLKTADDPAYELEATAEDGTKTRYHDPYAFPDPQNLTEYDRYLWGQGKLLYSYEKLGAHLHEIDGVKGVVFALWAPNAYRVSVIGDFNNWDARLHPMRHIGENGLWELFIPGLSAGVSYKYDINSWNQSYRAQKADPYAFASEHRPKTASVVTDTSRYTWNDAEWLAARNAQNPLTIPMNIYEVHLGSWRRKGDQGEFWLDYRDLAHQLVDYAKMMHYTHLELMPVAEHPLDMSWGYQVTGYYAPTSRFGSPEDFMYFVDYCHQNGIGVILDWVPAHFPKDGYALSYFDGTHLYEHEDPRKGEHPDWGTYIFNYGRNEVRNFLISNALYWFKVYHIDGLRVDAVSSMLYLDFGRESGGWIPNEYGSNENLDAVNFIKEFNEVMHREAPGAVTVAEESTAWAMVSRPTYIGGLGFTLKWNMGWMHDTLKYIQKDPIYRSYHHGQVTFSLLYAFTENFVLPLSHDEVVHGKGSIINKMAGDWWQKFASVRLLHGYQITHPGKKLNFMGSEFGQWREWSEDRSLDWHLLEQFETHRHLQAFVRDMNKFYGEQPALYEIDFEGHGFRWIEPNDAGRSTFSYIRFADNPDDFLVMVCNFTPTPYYDYRLGVPKAGYYAEVMNSDAEIYGGGNIGNLGGQYTEAIGWHGFEQSLNIVVPPLAIVVFKRQG